MYGSPALRRSLAALLMLSGAATTFAAGPHHQKLSRDLSEVTGENIPVIIQYKADPVDGDVGKVEGLGGREARSFRSIHSVHAKLSARALRQSTLR